MEQHYFSPEILKGYNLTGSVLEHEIRYLERLRIQEMFAAEAKSDATAAGLFASEVRSMREINRAFMATRDNIAPPAITVYRYCYYDIFSPLSSLFQGSDNTLRN